MTRESALIPLLDMADLPLNLFRSRHSLCRPMLMVCLMIAAFSENLRAHTMQSSQADIVEELMPEGLPPRTLQLNSSKRVDVVRRLEAARKQATGKRAQQIAYLLATLGSEYKRNRDYLLREFSRCASSTEKQGCDEDGGAFLIALYEDGHHEMLRPLVLAGARSDAALSETLGTFYADVLTQSPGKFLDVIGKLTVATQERVCSLAGAGDGSGMPQEKLAKTHKSLKAVGDKVALRCLRQIEISGKR